MTDLDTVWDDAISAAYAVRIPAGTWTASSLAIPANRTLLTEGAATVIQQKSGQPAGTVLIRVAGSKAAIAPGSAITLRGNIDTDTDEQNHGIVIRGASDISNIVIGDVLCEDIRGDGVYVGGLLTAKVSGVNIGNVIANNVYRSAVSITGGENVTVRDVTGSAVGFRMFNIEPGGSTQIVKNVTVGSIRGHTAQVAGQSAEYLVDGVTIDALDLDPGLTSNSTPNYSLHDTNNGLVLRNASNLRVRYYRARNLQRHTVLYVYNLGEVLGDELTFDYVEWAQCDIGETTYNAQMQVINCERISLLSGMVILPSSGKVLAPASETLVLDVSQTAVTR